MTGGSSLITGAVLIGALIIGPSSGARAGNAAASPTTATGDASIRPFTLVK